MSPKGELDLVLGRLEKIGKGIVLFHDSKLQTAQMLPDFLKELKAREVSLRELRVQLLRTIDLLLRVLYPCWLRGFHEHRQNGAHPNHAAGDHQQHGHRSQEDQERLENGSGEPLQFRQYRRVEGMVDLPASAVSVREPCFPSRSRTIRRSRPHGSRR